MRHRTPPSANLTNHCSPGNSQVDSRDAKIATLEGELAAQLCVDTELQTRAEEAESEWNELLQDKAALEQEKVALEREKDALAQAKEILEQQKARLEGMLASSGAAKVALEKTLQETVGCVLAAVSFASSADRPRLCTTESAMRSASASSAPSTPCPSLAPPQIRPTPSTLTLPLSTLCSIACGSRTRKSCCLEPRRTTSRSASTPPALPPAPSCRASAATKSRTSRSTRRMSRRSLSRSSSASTTSRRPSAA